MKMRVQFSVLAVGVGCMEWVLVQATPITDEPYPTPRLQALAYQM